MVCNCVLVFREEFRSRRIRFPPCDMKRDDEDLLAEKLVGETCQLTQERVSSEEDSRAEVATKIGPVALELVAFKCYEPYIHKGSVEVPDLRVASARSAGRRGFHLLSCHNLAHLSFRIPDEVTADVNSDAVELSAELERWFVV